MLSLNFVVDHKIFAALWPCLVQSCILLFDHTTLNLKEKQWIIKMAYSLFCTRWNRTKDHEEKDRKGFGRW
jgi:hypothetical protein